MPDIVELKENRHCFPVRLVCTSLPLPAAVNHRPQKRGARAFLGGTELKKVGRVHHYASAAYVDPWDTSTGSVPAWGALRAVAPPLLPGLRVRIR